MTQNETEIRSQLGNLGNSSFLQILPSLKRNGPRLTMVSLSCYPSWLGRTGGRCGTKAAEELGDAKDADADSDFLMADVPRESWTMAKVPR